MRLLMITQELDRDHDVLGITPHWVDALAREVDRLYVLTLATGRLDFASNVTVLSMGKNIKTRHRESLVNRLPYFFNFHKALGPLAEGGKIDGIFAHMCPNHLINAWPWAKLARIPLILWYAHAHVDTQVKWAHKLSTLVVTPDAQSSTLKHSRLREVGHGVVVPSQLPPARPQDGKTRILSVGRITPVKDLLTLVLALDHLKQENKLEDFEVTLAGEALLPTDFEYKTMLETEIQSRGLGAHITFAGGWPYPKVLEAFPNYDIHVNMQPMGGQGKAVLESLGYGLLPVICTPAFDKVLGAHQKALVFENQNPKDMAAKLWAAKTMARAEKGALRETLHQFALREHSVQNLMARIVGLF